MQKPLAKFSFTMRLAHLIPQFSSLPIKESTFLILLIQLLKLDYLRKPQISFNISNNL